MVTYYVHPVIEQHIWITRIYGNGKKAKRQIAFQIDMPGRWFEKEYNCHVDGCDYAFNSLSEALSWGANVLRMNEEKYKFVFVTEAFEI